MPRDHLLTLHKCISPVYSYMSSEPLNIFYGDTHEPVSLNTITTCIVVVAGNGRAILSRKDSIRLGVTVIKPEVLIALMLSKAFSRSMYPINSASARVHFHNGSLIVVIFGKYFAQYWANLGKFIGSATDLGATHSSTALTLDSSWISHIVPLQYMEYTLFSVNH